MYQGLKQVTEDDNGTETERRHTCWKVDSTKDEPSEERNGQCQARNREVMGLQLQDTQGTSISHPTLATGYTIRSV
jgi:hypothetical protein